MQLTKPPGTRIRMGVRRTLNTWSRTPGKCDALTCPGFSMPVVDFSHRRAFLLTGSPKKQIIFYCNALILSELLRFMWLCIGHQSAKFKLLRPKKNNKVTLEVVVQKRTHHFSSFHHSRA